jgi:hypothetical protein
LYVLRHTSHGVTLCIPKRPIGDIPEEGTQRLPDLGMLEEHRIEGIQKRSEVVGKGNIRVDWFVQSWGRWVGE